MMFIKVAFALLCSISNLSLGTCLMCTNCVNITLSFNNAAEFPPKCEGQLTEANVCQAIFRTNYLTKEIHLDLSGESVPIGNYYLQLYVQNKFDEPKMKDANMTYTCKTAADCAKQFYQLTIPTLIQNELVLNKIQAEVFDPTVLNVQQCVDNEDRPVTCQNGYGCHGYEIIEAGQINYEGECRNASTVTIFPRQYFQIILGQGDPPTSTDWNHFGFTCNKQNLCNTRQQIKKMVRLANDFYPWELIGVDSNAKAFMSSNYSFLLAVMVGAYILPAN